MTSLLASRLSQASCLLNPQTRLCKTRTISQLALEQSHKHILNVLHQSLPVPQSNAIALILASSISSVISSAWPVSICTNPRSRSTPDLQWTISCLSFPVLLAISRSIPNQARFLVLNLYSTSCFHLIFLFRLFTNFLQNRLHQSRIVHM